jgi:RNA polymerase sigma factor (sigma-70 family)
MPPDDPTIELLQRWHGGDHTALATLVERDRPWIEAKVRRLRGVLAQRHGETMDDFQDLMLRALQYAPRFVCANRNQFRGLLARMIGNLIADRVRRQGHQHLDRPLADLSQSHLTLGQAIASNTNPLDAAARSDDLAWMHLGMQFLEDQEREIVWQRQFLERNFAEIATDFDMTPDAVRMRFHRTLLRLATLVQRLQQGRLDELLATDGES